MVLHTNLPLVLSKGQYLQELSLLQGLSSMSFLWVESSCLVLVDARIKCSERVLFRRRPKIISESNSGLVVLDLPRISQLNLIVS